MRTRFLVGPAAILAAAGGLLMLGPGAPAPASQPTPVTLHFWHDVSPRPSSALSVGMLSVSCVASRACLAIGDKRQISLSWTSKHWNSKPSKLPGEDALRISCATARSCMAVGDGNDNTTAIAEAEQWNGSKWTTESPEQGPGIGTEAGGVSCPAANSCVLVGDYEATNQSFVPISEFWNGHRWKLRTIPVPAGQTFGHFFDVSCPALRLCVALGESGNGAFADIWNGVRWKWQGITTTQSAFLVAISCASVTACMAVGTDVAERWNGRTWQPVKLDIPRHKRAELDDVSCASATSCEAVGISGTTGLPEGQPLAERWDGKNWVRQANVVAPAGTRLVSLSGVSCSTRLNCLAVGFYAKAANGPLHLLAFHYS